MSRLTMAHARSITVNMNSIYHDISLECQLCPLFNPCFLRDGDGFSTIIDQVITVGLPCLEAAHAIIDQTPDHKVTRQELPILKSSDPIFDVCTLAL